MDSLGITRQADNRSRKSFLERDIAFVEFYNKLTSIYQFICDLDFLFLGRCFCQIRDTHSSKNSDSKTATITSFDSEVIFSSVKDTLNSILFCCETGNFGDAFTLLRKMNGDLVFFLYVLLVSSFSNIFSSEEKTKHENVIEDWYYNKLKNFYIDEILKFIAHSPETSIAVEKYKLNDEIKRIQKRLNDYVHSNGRKFYNQKIGYYYGTQLKPILNEFYTNTEYLVMSFLFLLVLIRGDLLSSTDFADALNAQQEPLDGSQYWVAPFVTDFIKEHIGVLGVDCESFLKNATCMDVLE